MRPLTLSFPHSCVAVCLDLNAVSLCFMPAALAQQPAASAVGETVRRDGAAVEQLGVRLVLEDDSSRIDELRVGGETRQISVTPKGGLPSYDMQPTGQGAGAIGASRVWKIFGF